LRAFVTGAAGFIGSNLSIALVERGWSVVGLDNLFKGDLANLTPIQDSDSFRFVEGDIRDRDLLLECTDGADVVVHLAALKIPRYGDAYETLMVNALAAEWVASVAAERGARLIGASTSDIYGRNPELPFREDSESVIGSPTVRRWSYAVSKMFEEQLLVAAHEKFGIGVGILRFFGSYGPREHRDWWGGPQSVFIEAALDGKPLPVHGTGRQTRSFTYISDHVDGIVGAMESDNPLLILNIGSTQEIAIADLAQLVWRLVNGDGGAAPIEVVPYETFGKYEDVQRRLPDLTRAREEIGFDAKVALEDGLRKTIEWHRSFR
jgi:UDP-glucose 4-epimerase